MKNHRLVAPLFATIIIKNQPAQNSRVTFTGNKDEVTDRHFKPRPDLLYSGTSNGLCYHLMKTGVSYQIGHGGSSFGAYIAKHFKHLFRFSDKDWTHAGN